jgi:hypothetical protein
MSEELVDVLASTLDDANAQLVTKDAKIAELSSALIVLMAEYRVSLLAIKLDPKRQESVVEDGWNAIEAAEDAFREATR